MLYLVPTLPQRRRELSASMAYFAYFLTTPQAQHVQPVLRFPCYHCGQPAPGNWCNTCEIMGNRPLRERPDLVTPYCNACFEADLTCRVCGTRPSEGPDEMAMLPPPPPGGGGGPGGYDPDAVILQIAGTNIGN